MEITKEYLIKERNDLAIKIANLKGLVENKNFHERYGSYQCLLMENQLKQMEGYLCDLSERMFHNNMLTDIETKIDFVIDSAKAADSYMGGQAKSEPASTYNAFLGGVNWALKHLLETNNLHKSRKQTINDAINTLNGKNAPVLYFDSEEYGYIYYWYDEKTDSLTTEYASISVSQYKDEDFNDDLIDTLLSNLEQSLIKHFKDEKGIELKLFED